MGGLCYTSKLKNAGNYIIICDCRAVARQLIVMHGWYAFVYIIYVRCLVPSGFPGLGCGVDALSAHMCITGLARPCANPGAVARTVRVWSQLLHPYAAALL